MSYECSPTLALGDEEEGTSGDPAAGAVKGVCAQEGTASTSDRAGHLGCVTADETGHAVIPSRVVDGRVKVWDIIGRSLAVHDGGAEGVSVGDGVAP